MNEQSLEPVREVSVDFYGDEIPTALVVIDEDGQQAIYVPMRPLVEYMGLSWSGQPRLHPAPGRQPGSR